MRTRLTTQITWNSFSSEEPFLEEGENIFVAVIKDYTLLEIQTGLVSKEGIFIKGQHYLPEDLQDFYWAFYQGVSFL